LSSSLEALGGILVGYNINEATLKEEVTHASSFAISLRHSPELIMHKHGNSQLSMSHGRG
jgi:hypothetical protein